MAQDLIDEPFIVPAPDQGDQVIPVIGQPVHLIHDLSKVLVGHVVADEQDGVDPFSFHGAGNTAGPVFQFLDGFQYPFPFFRGYVPVVVDHIRDNGFRYGEYFGTNEEYIRKYRFANAFHPFHGFSMMSCGHLAEEHTSAIYIVGARAMGLKTRATVEKALADAMRKYVGPAPNILALPQAFTTAAVHLCMKDPGQNSHSRDGASHPCCG